MKRKILALKVALCKYFNEHYVTIMTIGVLVISWILGSIVKDFIPRSIFKDNTPDIIFNLLGFLGVIVIILSLLLVILVADAFIKEIKKIINYYKKALELLDKEAAKEEKED